MYALAIFDLLAKLFSSTAIFESLQACAKSTNVKRKFCLQIRVSESEWAFQSGIYWPLLRWWMRNGFSTQKFVGYRMEGWACVEFQRETFWLDLADMLWNSRIDLQVVVFGAPLVFGDPCTEGDIWIYSWSVLHCQLSFIIHNLSEIVTWLSEGMKILETLSSRLRCYVHQVPRCCACNKWWCLFQCDVVPRLLGRQSSALLRVSVNHLRKLLAKVIVVVVVRESILDSLADRKFLFAAWWRSP